MTNTNDTNIFTKFINNYVIDNSYNLHIDNLLKSGVWFKKEDLVKFMNILNEYYSEFEKYISNVKKYNKLSYENNNRW